MTITRLSCEIKSIGSQLNPELLEVEITENIIMQNTEETKAIFQQIKERNIRIALDDFGTGYSSLSYLTSFEVDTLKIDRSFIMECTTKTGNLEIIKAIIAMGHSLGLKIVAEGIETEEQYVLLRDFGADEAQGFYFSPPLPSHKFSRLLQQQQT